VPSGFTEKEPVVAAGLVKGVELFVCQFDALEGQSKCPFSHYPSSDLSAVVERDLGVDQTESMALHEYMMIRPHL
jgi:hypothetical protein